MPILLCIIVLYIAYPASAGLKDGDTLKASVTGNQIPLYLYFILLLVALTSQGIRAQYKQPEHKILPEGVIPVTGPGSFDKAGSTYMLQNDISGEKSTIFLGKDVTLDLNGYTITYSDAGYEHVKNYGFEDGLSGWDLSKAPGAKLENTAEVHAFIGNKRDVKTFASPYTVFARKKKVEVELKKNTNLNLVIK